MKKWQKALIGIGIGLALIIMVVVSIAQVNKGVTTVQTGQVVKEDLTSLVTASGEIRPKSYTNVLAEGYGKITDIAVNEGDHVKKGDVLMHLESVQPGADVAAQEATVAAQEEGMKAAEANYQASVATQAQRQSDLEKAKFDWQRSQQLFKERLIAKSDYDASKAAYDGAAAAVKAAQAQVEQTSAARAQQSAMVQSGEDQLTHLKDVLRKTTYRAPISGIVTYIAVRVGENVVMGIQNSEGAFLMNISDMSVVTCEVKVDETDITNVKDGQPADVTIDALPGKTFKGHVTEVGQQAILRSTGQAATTQTTANTQEARDFKVVVTLDNPPAGLRPGLSATAKIQTAQRKNILTIPIQALAVRTQKDLDDAKAGRESSVTLAAPKPSELAAAKTDIQGVFVVHGRKADFVPVQTGITGVTDIEITSGLKDGDQIVTGSYKALRSLRPGAPIKIDNSIPKAEDTSGS